MSGLHCEVCRRKIKGDAFVMLWSRIVCEREKCQKWIKDAHQRATTETPTDA